MLNHSILLLKLRKQLKTLKYSEIKAKIADLRLKVKNVDEVLNSNNNSRTFQKIFDDKKRALAKTWT